MEIEIKLELHPPVTRAELEAAVIDPFVIETLAHTVEAIREESEDGKHGNDS